MAFQEAIKAVLGNYTKFDGRARRSEFWYFYLFFVVVIVVGDTVAGILSRGGGIIGGLANFALAVVALGLLIPYFAVGVRRMHDTDHSGWWILVPIVNLVFAVIDGTPGDNRFGPSPKGDAGAGPPPPPPPPTA